MSFKNQHVVSQVLLRRFAEGAGSAEVGVFEPDNLTFRNESPDRVGTIPNLVPTNPEKFEKRWSQVERMMTHAFKLIDERKLLADAKFSKAVRDFVALHFARGYAIHLMYQQMLPVKRQQFVTNMLATFSPEQIVYELKGLRLSRDAAVDVAPKLLASKFDDQMKDDNLMGKTLLDMFSRGRALAAENELEIWYAPDGHDFLIGDAPAVSYNHDTDQVGVLNGVAWRTADNILMPLGPKHVVAFAKKSGYFEATPETVVAVNKLQIRGAIHEVYYRPSSGLGARLQREMPGPPV